MEELPIRLLTNGLLRRPEQSELLRSSSAPSSPASYALTKSVDSQAMCTNILAASGKIQCEEHASLSKDMQPQESSSCVYSPLEREDNVEHACRLENTKPQEISTHVAPPKSVVTELFIPQKDSESQEASSCRPTLLERLKDAEDIPVLECTHLSTESTQLQESSIQILTALSGVDDTEQAVVELQEISTPVSRPSEGEDYTQHTQQQNNVEMQATFSHIPSPNRTVDDVEQAIQKMEGTVSQDMSTQISTTIRETEGTEYTADDVDRASEMRNMGSQEVSTSISSTSQRTSDACTLPQKNVELQETCTRSTVVELSLHQHMQQDDATKEEADMRSFIMHRFLPAAKEVAAEHESCIASLVSKNHSEPLSASFHQQSQRTSITHRINHSEASSPVPQQSKRTPIVHRIKSRAHQARRGFASSRPLHPWHQEDVMPYSMRSCGFFCLGLKTALFRAHRTVSASARSTLRKKSWAPHPSNFVNVDEDNSLISSEMEGQVAHKREALGGVAKHQSVLNIHAQVSHCVISPNSANGQESPQRHAVKYDSSKRGLQSSDGFTNGGCDAYFSQSAKPNLACCQFESMDLMQSPRHDDPVTLRNLVSVALEEQDSEISQQGRAPCNQKRTCDCKSTGKCHHVKTSSPQILTGKDNVSSSTLQEFMGGLETNCGKPADDYAFRSAPQDGDDEEEDESQFFDALSRLNSIKSNATFYTLGSPRSECEALRFESELINDEVGFSDASSQFETPRSSVSKTKSVPLHASFKGTNGKMSSLSQRVGRGLKLETHNKSPSKHDPCAAEQKLEPKGIERQTESFSRLWHPSLDSMSGLYTSKASTISPVFPAKCQNNTTNALGWPFGISTYQTSRAGGPSYHSQEEKSIEKYVVRGNVPSPPLPPSPRESWLGKAVTKNASRTSPLATLQQKEKVASARKKLDFIVANPDAERRWENVVKESQVQVGHLRFSEELHQHHPLNHNAIRPLKI